MHNFPSYTFCSLKFSYVLCSILQREKRQTVLLYGDLWLGSLLITLSGTCLTTNYAQTWPFFTLCTTLAIGPAFEISL